MARMKEWLTVSNDTQSFNKQELKAFIGFKKTLNPLLFL